MAKKKSTPATTEYVNFQIAEIEKKNDKRIEEMMSKLEEYHVLWQHSTIPDTPKAEEPTPMKAEPTESVNEPEEDQKTQDGEVDEIPEEIEDDSDADDTYDYEDSDLMSDREYLHQVYPELHRVVGMTPDQQFQEVLDYYRDKAVATLVVKELEAIIEKDHEALHATLDEELARRVNAWKAESDRRLKQLDAIEKKVAEDSETVLKTAKDLDAYYRRAVQLETLKERRSGLFIRGRNLLPFWFVILATAILLIAGFFTMRFALNTYQTNKTLQYELLHTIQSRQPVVQPRTR